MAKESKILVVDDSPNVLKIVSTILTARGYKVETCDDIDQVFERIQKGKPSLILLDIMMPSQVGLDGISLLNQLREKEETSKIPVIFLTGIATGTAQSEQELREKAGADDFISKPFDPEDMVQRVEKLIKKGKG